MSLVNVAACVFLATAVAVGCCLLVGGEMYHQQDEQQLKQLKHTIRARSHILRKVNTSILCKRRDENIFASLGVQPG